MLIRFEYIINHEVVKIFIIDCWDLSEVQREIELAKDFIEFDDCIVSNIPSLNIQG
jgi:hypothetical protein